jgi:hypothetical protein
MYEKTDSLADWLTEKAPLPLCQLKPSWPLPFTILVELVLSFLINSAREIFLESHREYGHDLPHRRPEAGRTPTTSYLYVIVMLDLAPLWGASPWVDVSRG